MERAQTLSDRSNKLLVLTMNTDPWLDGKIFYGPIEQGNAEGLHHNVREMEKAVDREVSAYGRNALKGLAQATKDELLSRNFSARVMIGRDP
jgi:hypothetical protein